MLITTKVVKFAFIKFIIIDSKSRLFRFAPLALEAKPMSLRDDPLMNCEETAKYMGGISTQTLALWRQNKSHPDLKYIKIGRQVRYRKSDVDAWLESQTVGAND